MYCFSVYTASLCTASLCTASLCTASLCAASLCTASLCTASVCTLIVELRHAVDGQAHRTRRRLMLKHMQVGVLVRGHDSGPL